MRVRAKNVEVIECSKFEIRIPNRFNSLEMSICDDALHKRYIVEIVPAYGEHASESVIGILEYHNETYAKERINEINKQLLEKGYIDLYTHDNFMSWHI